MERLTQADTAHSFATTAAHSLNEELTVILNGVNDAMLSLEPGHPARPVLADARTAVRRCADTASILLKMGSCRPLRFSFDD